VPISSTPTLPDLEEVYSEEHLRATSIIDSLFCIPNRSTMQDFHLLFFRGYEQQGPNFLAKIPPSYKLKLGDPPWSTVVEALGTSIPGDRKVMRYDRKQNGTLRRSFFRGIRAKRGGRELIATLKEHSPQGRNGWQLLWRMMRGAPRLKIGVFDFGRALRASGIIEFLEAPVPLDGDWAMAT
jgi:hypothetical protein